MTSSYVKTGRADSQILIKTRISNIPETMDIVEYNATMFNQPSVYVLHVGKGTQFHADVKLGVKLQRTSIFMCLDSRRNS
jgi:hypothetical protein